MVENCYKFLSFSKAVYQCLVKKVCLQNYVGKSLLLSGVWLNSLLSTIMSSDQTDFHRLYFSCPDSIISLQINNVDHW